MNRLKGKRVRIGKYAIPTLLLITLAVGTVAAVAYVILTYTMTATVVANPKVAFVDWSTGTTKANTFDYALNIFPSVKTVDENITYGIWNWDASSHTTYLRISEIAYSGASNPVELVNVTAWDGTGQLVSILWNGTAGDSLPQSWTSFTSLATTKYAIWIEVTATSGATAGDTSTISVDMKVENP